MSKILTKQGLIHYLASLEPAYSPQQIVDSHEQLRRLYEMADGLVVELRRQLAGAQGQLEIEREKVQIAISLLKKYVNPYAVIPAKSITDILADWENYIDTEAARRVEEK